ncbi:hypothetical protein C8F04DRAFT_1172205 [Mycena alexandri]|uniref:Single-stranded DNA-binding protein n=1 Tax=Mycena alexandri TaxID=1745969 RepID=A0AAD6XGV5_9AGAR|nr:hypothetical protein C8F04DRAFT_1172205 [Mycena alexandri]
MFIALRSASASRPIRAFSTSARRLDLAKLTLIGNLGKTPELKTTKNNKEYVSYTIATSARAPPGPEGGKTFSSLVKYLLKSPERVYTTTWHRVLSFLPGSNKYLTTLKPGSKVFVEAAYEIREPEAGADASTPQGQRQIFLRHENIIVIAPPRGKESTEEHFEEEHH